MKSASSLDSLLAAAPGTLECGRECSNSASYQAYKYVRLIREAMWHFGGRMPSCEFEF